MWSDAEYFVNVNILFEKILKENFEYTLVTAI